MSRAFEKRILRLPLIQRHHVRPAGRAPHEANAQERDEPQQAYASDTPIDRPFDPHIPLLGSIGGCTPILANTTLETTPVLSLIDVMRTNAPGHTSLPSW